MKTRDLVVCSLFASMTAVLSQISIPLPNGIPLTLQLFAVFLCGVILGAKKGFISTLVYVVLGAIGLPVFAGFTGGFQYIVGYSGGFIISFPLVAFIIGFVSEKTDNMVLILLSTILGLIVSYTIGTLVFSLVTNASISASLAACVIPFIFTDLLKCFIATVIGLKLKENISFKSVLN